MIVFVVLLFLIMGLFGFVFICPDMIGYGTLSWAFLVALSVVLCSLPKPYEEEVKSWRNLRIVKWLIYGGYLYMLSICCFGALALGYNLLVAETYVWQEETYDLLPFVENQYFVEGEHGISILIESEKGEPELLSLDAKAKNEKQVIYEEVETPQLHVVKTRKKFILEKLEKPNQESELIKQTYHLILPKGYQTMKFLTES